MTDFNKLADAPNSDAITRAAEILEGYAEFIKAEQGDNLERHPYIPDIEDAARILRAAGAADVAGLMAMIDAHGSARWETGYNEAIKAKAAATQSDKAAQKTRAALESALRVALAPRAQWQPIETAPKEWILLLGYFNESGKWRTVRGEWFCQEEIDDQWEFPENGRPGWYETCVNADEPPNCWPVEPTHWMPLPAAPSQAGAAQEQKP